MGMNWLRRGSCSIISELLYPINIKSGKLNINAENNNFAELEANEKSYRAEKEQALAALQEAEADFNESKRKLEAINSEIENSKIRRCSQAYSVEYRRNLSHCQAFYPAFQALPFPLRSAAENQ